MTGAPVGSVVSGSGRFRSALPRAAVTVGTAAGPSTLSTAVPVLTSVGSTRSRKRIDSR